nr:MAG TPA: hypothetical protein [Caudoviricetes sp.]
MVDPNIAFVFNLTPFPALISQYACVTLNCSIKRASCFHMRLDYILIFIFSFFIS